MITTLATTSAIALIAFLGLKAIEAKKDKLTLISVVIRKGDKHVARVAKRATCEGARIGQKTKIYISEHMPHHTQKLGNHLQSKSSKIYSKASYMIRGSSKLKNKGSVSLFLKQISTDDSETK